MEGRLNLPSTKTVKVLFARAGNRCAYPGCPSPLVESNDCVTGEICHIRALHIGGPRFDKSQTDSQRNHAENLILMCSRHHKIVDDDPQTYSVDALVAMKREVEAFPNAEITPSISRKAELLYQHFIHVQGDLRIDAIHAHTVTIKSPKQARPKITLSPEVIGGNPDHRAYLKYLIDRYHEFASGQSGREFKFAVVYRGIKNRFKATWEHIPISRFEEVVRFMHEKIDGTIVGRLRKSKSQSSYEPFDRFLRDHR